MKAQARKRALRPADQVMRLERMGSAHATRLSFMRILLRRMQREGWTFSRPSFEIGDDGTGHALYAAHGPNHTYTLVAFAHDLPDHLRSDRVIAEAWDATFALFDGVPTGEDIERLRANVPLQEAGRVSQRELVLSRANRSTRLWAHVVDALAAGHQPDAAKVAEVGYLMRTTAVYGSGKFGAADRALIAGRPECAAPFQMEMLTVWLIRTFVMDLVEHLARVKGGAGAATLDPALRRRFAIGNSTGLGMAPFLINHPVLLNNWVAVREEALSRVLSVAKARESEIEGFKAIFARAMRNAKDWRSEHPLQIEKLEGLRADMAQLETFISGLDLTRRYPWAALWDWGQRHLGLEGQEKLFSLLLEPYGELVDDLADCLAAEDTPGLDGKMSVGRLRAILKDVYGWALDVDWSTSNADARCWYVSEEKLEPRLGQRHEEPIGDYEQPLCPGRDAARLAAALGGWPDETPVAELALAHPEHRHILRRAQVAARLPYAEIRDNTIGAGMLPIDMLRFKLAQFGAGRFDPRSDRWVRIAMFGGAPFPDELADWTDDAWVYP